MVEIKRYVEPVVVDDLRRKMVFLAGPRQCGKTTVAKRLLQQFHTDPVSRYMNWDAGSDRDNIIKEHFPAAGGLLVLDEIHKFSRWRQPNPHDR